MISATILEAQTKLSELVERAQAGEEVILTSGQEETPVARLSAIEKAKPKRLGVRETPGFVLGEAFWEPMSEEDLRTWHGDDE
jgi:antitoxin (DNA-binding transcriptional repressor) of toxin-antitoxin stability system